MNEFCHSSQTIIPLPPYLGYPRYLASKQRLFIRVQILYSGVSHLPCSLSACHLFSSSDFKHPQLRERPASSDQWYAVVVPPQEQEQCHRRFRFALGASEITVNRVKTRPSMD